MGPLDAAVDIGPLGRQDDEFEAFVAAMVFEDGHELGPAVDLDSPDLEGRAREQLVEQVPCGVGGGRGRNVADRPFGDRIVGGEVFDRPVGLDVDEEGVDLDEFAGRPRCSPNLAPDEPGAPAVTRVPARSQGLAMTYLILTGCPLRTSHPACVFEQCVV